MAEDYLHTFSYEDFVRQVKELAAASEVLGDGWALRHVRTTDGPEEVAFLVKKTTCNVNFSMRKEEKEGEEQEAEEGRSLGDEDEATVSLVGAKNSSCVETIGFEDDVIIYFEYHVTYSPSYQVPVLYFTASYSSGKQIPMERVWQIVSPFHSRDSGMRWGQVTQTEHPILCSPFYYIHPCHTAAVMRRVIVGRGAKDEEEEEEEEEGGEEGGENVGEQAQESEGEGKEEEKMKERGGGGGGAVHYLLSWLSMYGPVVGLKLPLDYLKML